ncbi:MAG: CAP domain-containing protein [Egibacteraceae bacterium]
MLCRRLVALAVALFCALSLATAGPAAADERDWVRRLNRWRGEYGTSAVTAEDPLSRALDRHVRYMLAVRQATHEQNPSHPAYSPAGARAAQRSILRLSWQTKRPARPHRLIDRWLASPFHALAMLDPRLQASGFAVGTRKGYVASGLDVLAGRAPQRGRTEPLRRWPSPRTTWLPQLDYRATERPDPLSFCPARYREAEPDGRPLVGLPLILSLGAGNELSAQPTVALSSGGQELGVCVVTEHSGAGDAAGTATAGLTRGILAGQHSILIVPRRPLERGRSYRVAVQLADRRIVWSFRTGSDRPAPAFWPLRRGTGDGRAVALTAFVDGADLSRPPPLALEARRPKGRWRVLAVRKLSQRGQLTFRVSPRMTTRYRVHTVEPRPRRSRVLTVRR